MKISKKKYQNLINRYSDFLKEEIPELEVLRKSFLECAGINHKELINSNLLEFYLDPLEQHNFGNLFLEALISLIDDKKRINIQDKFETVEVVREETTESGRIDISIYGYLEGSEKVESIIIIENKIHHSFENNPYDDYWNNHNEVIDKYKVGILLTLRPEKEPKNFKNITHLKLINKVLNNIGLRIPKSDDRHLLFLKDYKLTIDNLTEKNKMNDTLKFAYENGVKISELVSLDNNVFNHLKDQVKVVVKEINLHGFKYKFMSSNYYSFSLSSSEDRIKIKHYVYLKGLFLEKRISIHIYSLSKDHQRFLDYFESNRETLKDKLASEYIDIEEVENWGNGSTIYGEYWPVDITIEEVSDFGKFFKDEFIKIVIPFEKKIREEFKRNKDNYGLPF